MKDFLKYFVYYSVAIPVILACFFLFVFLVCGLIMAPFIIGKAYGVLAGIFAGSVILAIWMASIESGFMQRSRLK